MPKDLHTIIDHPSPGDALAILKILAREDDRLGEHIVEVATSHLSSVDPEEIAPDPYAELDALNVEEVWDRVGPKRRGYVEPQEAAAEMIEQVVEPFSQETRRHAQMGLHAQARQVCIGLLLGLYRLEHESTNEFKDWAVDGSAAFARRVIDLWKSGSPGQADASEVRQFLDDQLKGWGPGDDGTPAFVFTNESKARPYIQLFERRPLSPGTASGTSAPRSCPTTAARSTTSTRTAIRALRRMGRRCCIRRI